MKRNKFLFDTHALIFWNNNEVVTEEFINFFDRHALQGNLYISSISFWEIALLVKKGKIKMENVELWKSEILTNTNIRLIEPTVSEMINSTLLTDHHKDPFDRLLISQANNNGLFLVTKDKEICTYDVKTFWI
ncbi:MAG: type II toxin-antitoxin system VapC family toxin [Nitrospinae bacterium]|nr:type II toxin-antitoxin system VapC family toxin [Nitrospinota bacterium]